MKLDTDVRKYQKFTYYCEEVELKITARLKAHEQTLLSGAAMFDASNEVTRQEWQAYVKRLRIHEHFNGIQGLGFSQWIPAAQLSAHQASIRAEGFPDYTIRPEGEREAYTAIIFLEPFSERNLRAFGYDMYSEPVRRAAMVRARDENIVTLSGRVILIQETDKNVQAGTLMYVPVYKKNKPIDTVEQRRDALFGWIYSPFRMNDLLNNILSSTQDIQATQVRLRVYDGNNTQAALLYDSNPNYEDTKSLERVSLVEITNNFNGTIWTLQFEQIMDGDEFNYYSNAWVMLGTGILFSTLLFLLLRSYLTTRVNASNIAAELTRELQESESRFRVLADSAPVLIWLAGTDKLCYHFNKVWLNFTGRTLKQELGNGWAEGVHADDLQRCLNTYVTAFDARLPFKMEYRLRRYDGEYRWLLDTGTPRFTDDGIFLGYIGSCIDISERKQTEHLLKKESEKNLALLHNASDGIHILDINGNIIEVSDSFCNMLGYSREEMIGMNVTQWDAGFSADECIKLVVAQFNKPARSLFETCHRCKSGSIIDVEVSGFPLELEGKPVLFNSSRDITARKKLEHQLHNISAYTRNLIEVSLDPLVTISANGKITDVNKATEKVTGFTREQLINSDFSDYFTDPNKASAGYLEVFSKGYVTDYPLVIKHRNGHLTDVLYNASVYKDERGEIAGVFAAARDITERKHMEEALKASESFTVSILDSLTAHIAVLDEQGDIVMVNQAWRKFGEDNCLNKNSLSGLGSNYFAGYSMADQIYDQGIATIFQGIRSVLTGTQRSYHTEYPCHAPNEQRWFYMTVSPLQGSKRGVVISHQNITQRKQLEIELRIAATAFESQEGMMITDANEIILKVNKAFTLMTGYSAAEVIGQTPRLLNSGRQDSTFYTALWKSINETGAWQGEIWNRRKDGEIYPEQLTITAVKDDNDQTTHYVATLTDITERKATEEYINRLAFYDVLTQLPNRRLLQERVKHGIELHNRTGSVMAVMMLDLDKFKAVNDTLGHAAGDELLQQVAKRMKDRLREVDMVARLGGDEFVILIDDVRQHDHLGQIAKSIIDALSQTFTLYQGPEVHIGASIGIAIHPIHGNSAEELMDNADAALYKAKDRGRGCFVYFSEAFTQKLLVHAPLQISD